MYFVYLIRSINYSDKTYIGYTKNLNARLEEHNSGLAFHTSKYKPWELVVYVAFKNQKRAVDLEQYLKSGSGRVFVKRHLL